MNPIRNYFRPSCMADEGRFIAWHMGMPVVPTAAMKRGTLAEQVAMLGSLEVAHSWERIPSSLPLNEATGKRYATWAAWQEATGIDPKAENAVDCDTWAQAIAAAKAIRAALPDTFQWQISGQMDVGVNVPEGYAPKIVGTCDLLLPEAVMDIKVVSDPNEFALKRNYQWQVSTYCHMFDRPYGAILAVFPLDKDELVWSSKIVQIDVQPLEAIEAQCSRLTVAHRRALETQNFQSDIEQPYKAA